MKFDDGGRLTVAFLFALTVIIMYNKFDLRLYRLLRETPLQTSAEGHAQALPGGGKQTFPEQQTPEPEGSI